MRSYNHYNTVDDEMTAQLEMANKEVLGAVQSLQYFSYEFLTPCNI
jgi:hypothetical protein